MAPPTNDLQAVRLGDLKDAVESKFKMPVRLAATSPLAATYSTSAKTLTADAYGALTLDGVNAAAGNRVLVLGQAGANATENGIYVVTTLGAANAYYVLTRAADFDDDSKIYAGVKVHVTEGDDNADVTYVLATDDPITLDTDALSFTADTGLFPPIREYKITLASGTTTPVTITHSLGTLDVTVEVIRVSDGSTILVDTVRSDVNNVVLTFYANLTEAFRVLVRAV
jgi:hypothetical protein